MQTKTVVAVHFKLGFLIHILIKNPSICEQHPPNTLFYRRGLHVDLCDGKCQVGDVEKEVKIGVPSVKFESAHCNVHNKD